MDPATAELHQMQQLKRAIHSASHETLKSTLEYVCTTYPVARQGLANLLLVGEDQVPIESFDQESSNQRATDEKSATSGKQNGHQQANGSKRVMPRYVTCENCEKEYDVTENTGTSCKYHAERGYVDYDFFCDDDEFSDLDNDETREEFPEGLIYGCCNQRGDKGPCVTDWHREEQPMKRKRVH